MTPSAGCEIVHGQEINSYLTPFVPSPITGPCEARVLPRAEEVRLQSQSESICFLTYGTVLIAVLDAVVGQMSFVQPPTLKDSQKVCRFIED